MGRPAIDLTGQIFGRLKVLHRDETRPSGAGKSVYGVCECQNEGNIVSIRSDKLRRGITKSCGCLSKEVRTELFLKDLTGQKFGKLTVIERDMSKPTGKGYFAYGLCKCDCGNEELVSVRTDHLRDGTTSGCGCTNSIAENLIRDIFRENNIDFQQQYKFEDLKVKDFLRFDFAIFKENKLCCLLEYQGEQHFKPYHFDTEERFQKRLEYDQLKRNYCKQKNITLIEIPYTDFNKLNFDYLKEKIGL